MKLLTFEDFHKFQVYVIAKAMREKTHGLFLDTGLGKTIIALTIFDQLQKRGLVESMLVLCPKRVMYNVWRQEAQAWDHTKRLRVSLIHGKVYGGKDEVSRRRGFYTKADVYVTNYETIPWLAKMLHPYLNYKPLPYQMVVYDESTKMKHSKTRRYKAWRPFALKIPYRYALTGTPMPNGVADLYGQMYLLDGGVRLGSTLTSFRSRFLEVIPAGTQYRQYRERPGARVEIIKRIKDKATYMQKTDYLQLPPLKFNPIWVDLPKKLQSMYDELEKEFYLELGEVGVEAFNAASLSMKLRQFLQGFVYTENRGAVSIHTEKLDMLREMVDVRKKKGRCLEGMGNTIIAYFFKQERYILQELFPDAPTVDGATTDKETEHAINMWNTGTVPVLLANSASLNYGLNLQHGGNHIVWYAMTWNAEHYSQLIDRLWRQRQEKTVFAHHILFRGTVEETIFQAVQKKNANQQDILNALKGRLQT